MLSCSPKAAPKEQGAHRGPLQKAGVIGPFRFPDGPAASRLGEAERLLVEAALSQMEEIRIRQAGRLGVKHPGLGSLQKETVMKGGSFKKVLNQTYFGVFLIF